MRSIDRSRKAQAPRLLYALNSPLCGIDVCRRLLAAYPLEQLVSKTQPQPVTPDLFSDTNQAQPVSPDLFSDTNQAQPDLFGGTVTADDPAAVFAHVPGIGPEKSASFVRWFRHAGNMARYRRLTAELEVSEPVSTPAGDLCQGLTFVITGDVHHYKNRNELKAYIESQGGKVASAVSGATSFLINNDINSTSGKNQKARQLGIPILSEDDFIAKYGSSDA